MAKKLPARPNLDHLRRQAKSLLAALTEGDKAAVATLQNHLPAAKSLTAEQIIARGFRLADAQAAIARESGFAGWPHLARHVELLRSLEGSWQFERLEIDGETLSPAAFAESRLLIDGDRFRTETPEGNYEGIFNINVEAEPAEIDIEFVAGPEAGNWNYGIFRLVGDQLDFCVDVNGKPRPKAFRSAPRSGHANETLRRISPARPTAVDGGKKTARAAAPAGPDQKDFAFVASPLTEKLQGEWIAIDVVRDGEKLPAPMLKLGRRVAVKNDVQISFGGRIATHALSRFDESVTPIAIDYCNIGGMNKGALQHGIFEWKGDDACFCIAPAGAPRPAEFSSEPGSGRTLSRWRLKR